jgi:hypothetical protein
MFDSLNSLQNLQSVEADGFGQLVEKLRQIPLPVRVVFTMNQGSKFYAAILTDAKIVKKKKGDKENGSS